MIEIDHIAKIKKTVDTLSAALVEVEGRAAKAKNQIDALVHLVDQQTAQQRQMVRCCDEGCVVSLPEYAAAAERRRSYRAQITSARQLYNTTTIEVRARREHFAIAEKHLQDICPKSLGLGEIIDVPLERWTQRPTSNVV